jgi:protein phosphatase
MGLVVVADGMGGCPCGDEASRMAVDFLVSHFREARNGGDRVGAQRPEDEALRFMENGVKRANAGIIGYARQSPERQGMGTTLTALHLDGETGRWVVGHVGDSRVYRCSEGELVQITRDHTWVQSQVEKGSLSQEAARYHPFGHILSQALGVDPELNIEVRSGTASSGETYLLCSDGLTAVLSDEQLLEILSEQRGDGPSALARTLVDRANEGGGPDNVTVGVLQTG